jgi:hypothetical protein
VCCDIPGPGNESVCPSDLGNRYHSFSDGQDVIRETMPPYNLISCWILPFLILAITTPCVLSLHVVLGSNCTAFCSDQNPLSNTSSADVTCRDNDYESTAVGKTFRDCVTCQFESKSFEHGTRQTDLGWGLCMYFASSMVFG